jgi:hypothetical protein
LLTCNGPSRLGLATFALIATFGVAQGAECSGETASSALTDAREVVGRLYKTPAFVNARSGIDAATISELEPYLTDKLVSALRDFRAALLKADKSADLHTKAPYPAGPIFYSNYEGMDKFSVVNTSAAVDQSIHVTVEMNFDSPFGSAKWSDIAVLRCDSRAWKLDDVIFDPNQTAGPSLRSRIAVR